MLLAVLLWTLPVVPLSFAQEVRRVTQAQTRQKAARTDRGEWVIAAYLGGARTAASTLKISQPARDTELAFDAVRFDGRSFDPPLYYGVRGSYFIRGLSFLGIEAEFIHLKVYSDPTQPVRVTGRHRGVPLERELPLGQIVQEYSISHGANLLLFNLAARWRMRPNPEDSRSRFVLATRFGLGPTIPHTESTIEGEQQQQYEWGRAAWQWSAGLEFHLWQGLYALGEYKFTRTRQRGQIVGGFAESLLRTHHGVFGLTYHF
ncbi:MAG TPA: hypothetical protein VNM72_12065 [Blastocatellia bacterium]|nr:hypothetical protein [Blastocatellia bacterium]